jgi:hypothetical protein
LFLQQAVDVALEVLPAVGVQGFIDIHDFMSKRVSIIAENRLLAGTQPLFVNRPFSANIGNSPLGKAANVSPTGDDDRGRTVNNVDGKITI